MNIKKPRGTKDILPTDIHKWHYLENVIRDVSNVYNYKEIRTPMFESTDLFTRGVGQETDIVGKEMYTFIDKGDNSITLKPEMTAPVMRAYLENSLVSENLINKLYYISSIFRYEKPQEGRYREHTQFGAELVGSDDIMTDVELISLATDVYNRIGIPDFKVKINSIGRIEERKKYIVILREYLNKYLKDLSEDSKRRLDANTLRILDSKDKNDKKITDTAPRITEHLEAGSRERFNKVLSALDDVNIKYEIDFRLVRGLDYYTDTTFEFISDKLGSQDALGGGGRYDGLVEILGGKPTPGIGFASGMERLLIVAEKNNFKFPLHDNPEVYFILLNDEARTIGFKLLNELRKKNIKSEVDHLRRSFKAQMRDADRVHAGNVYIIGEEELNENSGILRNMNTREQTKINFDKLTELIVNENKKS